MDTLLYLLIRRPAGTLPAKLDRTKARDKPETDYRQGSQTGQTTDRTHYAREPQTDTTRELLLQNYRQGNYTIERTEENS